MRPQAEENLLYAASEGDLATLTRLVEEGVNVNATLEVSAALPAAPNPLRPSPSVLAACCPALTTAADRVGRHHRASVGRHDGPHEGG